MSTEGYIGRTDQKHDISHQKYKSLSESEEVEVDPHVVTLQIQPKSQHTLNSNSKLKIRERGQLWILMLSCQSILALPFAIFPPIAREYYLCLYIPISIYLWLVTFSCLWVEVEDFGSYLSIKTGPLSVFCCCQKSEIRYSNILKWQLYNGDACSTVGVGYTCTCDSGCVKTFNLKYGITPVQIILKPNAETGCAKSIICSIPKNKIQEIFGLLEEKCSYRVEVCNDQYKVVYPTGAVCREDKNISSKQVGILPINTIVTVEEIDGRRCRITIPKKGWLSLHTANGHSILLKEQKQYLTVL